MLATNISHALGLHMHQPPGSLALLMEASAREAEQIIRCDERPPPYAQQYADVRHRHVGFSGILLEQLLDKDIVDRYRHIIDIPAMLDAYRNRPSIELIGMGYCHPIFPLVPAADWGEDWLPRLAALTDAADAIIGALEAGGAAGEADAEGAQDTGLGSRR
jgi:hypothetical protein